MKRVGPILRLLAEAVAVFAFASLFALFLLQVFMRYVMNMPLDWTQEASVLLYIWGVFWTAAFLTRVEDHVAFTLLYDMARPTGRRIMLGLGLAVLAAAFLIDLPYAADYVQFMSIMSTPVTAIRFDLAFSIFPVFMAATAIACLATLIRLFRSDWTRVTGDDSDPTQPADERGFE